VAGVLYDYALQEVTSSGGTITVARANAGIEVPAQTCGTVGGVGAKIGLTLGQSRSIVTSG